MRMSDAVVLDASRSMRSRNVWTTARKIAAALVSELTTSTSDVLALVFSDYSRRVATSEVERLECDQFYGTNFEHALAEAQRLLLDLPPPRRVFLVSDGEPTAHCGGDGTVYFSFPPVPETWERTRIQFKSCGDAGIALGLIVLGEEPRAANTMRELVKVVRGLAVFVTGRRWDLLDERPEPSEHDALVPIEAALVRAGLQP